MCSRRQSRVILSITLHVMQVSIALSSSTSCTLRVWLCALDSWQLCRLLIGVSSFITLRSYLSTAPRAASIDHTWAMMFSHLYIVHFASMIARIRFLVVVPIINRRLFVHYAQIVFEHRLSKAAEISEANEVNSISCYISTVYQLHLASLLTLSLISFTSYFLHQIHFKETPMT